MVPISIKIGRYAIEWEDITKVPKCIRNALLRLPSLSEVHDDVKDGITQTKELYTYISNQHVPPEYIESCWDKLSKKHKTALITKRKVRGEFLLKEASSLSPIEKRSWLINYQVPIDVLLQYTNDLNAAEGFWIWNAQRLDKRLQLADLPRFLTSPVFSQPAKRLYEKLKKE